MALSNYEKQKRWRQKNRALYNFQQRQRRKAKGGDAVCPIRSDTTPTPTIAHARDAQGSELPEGSNAALTFEPEARRATLDTLRKMIENPPERPVETPVTVPTVFHDDYGRVISETQWKRLQKLKQDAKDGGYERDDYSQ